MEMISNKETALLGLLCEGPMHPYEIEKTAQYRSMRTWTEISMSSIYKVLEGLEKKKLVSSEIKLSKKKIRQKVYTVTKSGAAAMRAKLKTILSQPENLIHRFDLGVYFLFAIDKKTAIKAMLEYDKKIQEKIKGYKNLEKFLIDMKCPDYRLAIAKRPVYLWEAERRFIKDYISDIK